MEPVIPPGLIREAILGSKPGAEWIMLRDCIADDDELLRHLTAAEPGSIAQGQLLQIIVQIVVFLEERESSGVVKRGVRTAAAYSRVRSLLLRDSRLLKRLLQLPNQTNNPLRAAALYPALCRASQWAETPLALIEIGPAIGFNLCCDKYRIVYPGIGIFGDASSRCELRYSLRLPGRRARVHLESVLATAPRVASRLGLERLPVRPGSLAERVWLSGTELGKRALMLVRRVRPRIVGGDALDTLERAMVAVPSGVTPCVISSFVTYQFSQRGRDRLETVIARIGRQRQLVRISLGEGRSARGARLDIGCHVPGRTFRQVLGFCQMHGDCGSFMDWIPPAPETPGS